MDRDGDGVITRAEWRGSDQSFRVHDWNGDGVLSGEELNPSARPPARPADRDDYMPDYRFNDWTEARFAELDHNRDGRITRDEWHFDLESFRRADHNGDGRITRDEFLGRDSIDDDRADRFDDLDYNRDRRVTRDEWHGGQRAFDNLDRNHDGVLSREEVLNPGETPFADLFASLDVNHDQRVTIQEWHWSRRSFESRDMNRDGVLTRDELNAPVGTSGTSGRVETATYRAGYNRGLAEGREAGHGDKASGHGWDLEGQTELERADSGYTPQHGALREYQEGYRAGFRVGYREGFGPR